MTTYRFFGRVVDQTTHGGRANLRVEAWDAENRVQSISGNGHTVTYAYDADGQRVKKVEDGQTTVYLGNSYEKNVTANTVTVTPAGRTMTFC